MGSAPRNLDELDHADRRNAPWLVFLDLAESHGRPDVSRLAVLAEHSNARALRVSGLDQKSFEHLVSRYGRQFPAIEFSHCPRIADLSPLEDLPDLRLVSFYWNQRATRLWNLAGNPRLTGLRFDDFTRLHDLRDLPAGASLTELRFGDRLWPTSVYESLEPLAALDGLRSLTFNPKRIEDGRIEPLAELTGLQALSFPANMFTTRQVAWLRARLPATVQSQSLGPVIWYQRHPEAGEKVQDARLVGKRKPFLDSVADQARISKHIDSFEQMVEDFRRDPALKPG